MIGQWLREIQKITDVFLSFCLLISFVWFMFFFNLGFFCDFFLVLYFFYIHSEFVFGIFDTSGSMIPLFVPGIEGGPLSVTEEKKG